MFFLRHRNMFYVASGGFRSCLPSIAVGFLSEDDALDKAEALNIHLDDVHVMSMQDMPERMKFAIEGADGWLSIDGGWVSCFPGHRIKVFASLDEAKAAIPADSNAKVRWIPQLKDGVGPCSLMVGNKFVRGTRLVEKKELRTEFANVAEARAALETLPEDIKNDALIVYLDRAKNMMLLHEQQELHQCLRGPAYVAPVFSPAPPEPAPA